MQKFKKGEFYMHSRAMDVCIEVVDVIQGVDYQRITAFFWVLGYTGKPWLADFESKTIKIFDKASDEWKHIDYELLTQARTKAGPPIA